MSFPNGEYLSNFQWLRRSLHWQNIQALKKPCSLLGVSTVLSPSIFRQGEKINMTLSLKIFQLAETITLHWPDCFAVYPLGNKLTPHEIVTSKQCLFVCNFLLLPYDLMSIWLATVSLYYLTLKPIINRLKKISQNPIPQWPYWWIL